MRGLHSIIILLLSITLIACSGIETRPTDTDKFAAGNYSYYKWRSAPLKNTSGSSDLLYQLDPVVRAEVDKQMQAKGYILDADKAQFSIDYLQAMGMRQGAISQDGYNGIDTTPTARPNRMVNQAMVDNAHALSGVQETSNLALQFNSIPENTEVWRVVITKIVENSNEKDPKKIAQELKKGIKEGLHSLPKAD